MKKVIALVLALICMGTMPSNLQQRAAAEVVDDVIARVDSMIVVNCEEWVSLREGPSTSAARMTKVPKGATVTGCIVYSEGFTFCKYNGIWGYILSEYLSGASAQAQTRNEYIGSMQVVNCKEWVSLRASASKSSARLVKIPLGMVVSNCHWYSEDFIRCEYGGRTGYVLAEYLIPLYSYSGSMGVMQVVNCEEWVSLRASANTSSSRLAKIPLGAVVTDCAWHTSEFIRCTYNGRTGYVLAKYLTSSLGQCSYELGTMQVANCGEWVSLRASDSTSSKRLAKIPLGAKVYDCTGYYGDFIHCTYEGQSGYVLAEYLTAPEAAVQSQQGDLILEHSLDGCTVYVYRSGLVNSERLYAECLDSEGGILWTFQTSVPFATELSSTDAFIGGTKQEPMVLLHNVNEGLHALDFYTGQVKWMLPKETVDLGGSISHAVAEDGTMYIGGYYGPDPVAISVNGEVLWQADARHDAYWMYEIAIENEAVIATYECIDEHEAAGRIGFDFNGELLWVEWF